MVGPRSAPAAETFDALAQPNLLVVSGKGGVGRTTVSALLGLAIARRGRRVLVATVGHDDRLAWMMGADRLEARPLEVADGLSIQRLEPMTCIREYGAMMLRSQRVAGAVFGNRVVRRLLSALPGVDDFAVLGKVWHEATRADRFDTVVFDGPTTGHLWYTLGVPNAILGAIGEGPLTREAQAMQGSLEDPAQTRCVLVGLPEQWPLTELGELSAALRRDVRTTIGSIVVNGLWPTEPAALPRPEAADDPGGSIAAAFAGVDRATTTGRRQREVVDAWRGLAAAESVAGASVLEIPWRFAGLSARAQIEALYEELASGQEAA